MDFRNVIRLNKHQLSLIESISNCVDDITKYNLSIYKKSFKYESVNDLIDDALICLLNDLQIDLVNAKAEYVDYFGIHPIDVDLPFDFYTVECGAPTEENTSESE